jgi:hypothetical protein
MSWELRFKTEFDCCNNDLMSKQKSLKTMYSLDKERAIFNIKDGNGSEFAYAAISFVNLVCIC